MKKYEPKCVGTKACPKCGQEKHVLSFASDCKRKDGLQVYCRECMNKMNKMNKKIPSKEKIEKRFIGYNHIY